MDTRKIRVKKRPLYKRKGFWWSVLIPFVLIAGVLGYYWYRFNHFVSAIGDSKTTSTVAWSGTDRVNIMLFGVDNRGGDPHPRTDVNLLVSIDPNTHTAQMFSILRDTWYKIPGYSSQKINAAYSLGGPDLAIKTFSDFLQIPINYYAVTDFQGFEKAVDAVGGINLDVEKDMNYVDDGTYDIHLKKGYQHLDGQHALEYVRFRHDAMGDFSRTERQRKFLKALAEQMIKPANILKLPSVLDAVQPYLKTNMTMDDMLKLGMLGKDINWTNMQSQQLPDMKNLKTGIIDGEDSVIPDVYATRVLVHQMLGMNDTIVKDPSVEYNGPVNSPQSGTTLIPSAPAEQSPDPTNKPSPSTAPSNPFGDTTGKGTTSGGTDKNGTTPDGGVPNSGTNGTVPDTPGQGGKGTGGNPVNSGTGDGTTTGQHTGGTGAGSSQGGGGETGSPKSGTSTGGTTTGGNTGTTTQTGTTTGTTGTGSTTGNSNTSNKP